MQIYICIYNLVHIKEAITFSKNEVIDLLKYVTITLTYLCFYILLQEVTSN